MRLILTTMNGYGLMQKTIFLLFILALPVLLLGLFHVYFIYASFAMMIMAVCILLIEELVSTIRDD